MNQTWKKVVTTLRQLELQQLKLQLSNFVNQIIIFDFDFNFLYHLDVSNFNFNLPAFF